MTQGASEIREGAVVKCYFSKWGVDLTPSRGVLTSSRGVLTSSRGVQEDFFLNIEVKSLNLVHFERKMKRSMDTSLNTHMKQNCKQIYFFFMDILQITPLLRPKCLQA